MSADGGCAPGGIRWGSLAGAFLSAMVGYSVALWFGAGLSMGARSSAVFDPVAGAALVVGVLAFRRGWPTMVAALSGVAVAVVGTGLAAGRTPALTVVTVLACVAGQCAAAPTFWALRRRHSSPPALLTALLGAAGAALACGAVVHLLFGTLVEGGAAAVTPVALSARFAGMLTLAPTLLLFSADRHEVWGDGSDLDLFSTRMAEGIVQTVAVVAIAVGALGRGPAFPLALLLLPALLWGAVRLGVRWGAADVLVLASVTALAGALGHAPLGRGSSPAENLLVMGLSLVSAMALVVVVAGYVAVGLRTKALLRVQEGLLHSAFEEALPAMLIVSVSEPDHGAIVAANRSARRMLGGAPDRAATRSTTGQETAPEAPEAAGPDAVEAVGPVVPSLGGTEVPEVRVSAAGVPEVGVPGSRGSEVRVPEVRASEVRGPAARVSAERVPVAGVPTAGVPAAPERLLPGVRCVPLGGGASEGGRRGTGLSAVEDPEARLIGTSWADLVHTRDRQVVEDVLAMLSSAEEPTWRGEIAHARPDGTPFTTLVAASCTVTSDYGLCASVQVLDIHDRKAAENALRQMALHDPLTGLPNRLLLAEHIDKALAVRERRPGNVALLYIDVDGFKEVNDVAGHAAGDELLAAMAERMVSLLRPTDTVARVGGDEFVVLCPDLTEPGEAQAIAQRLVAAFEVPFPVGKTMLQMSVSVGVAVAEEQATAETLLGDADAAMYRAKRQGRNRFETFADELRTQAERRVRVASQLRRALADGELRVHYQPIVDLRDGVIMGAEALVRWQHPELGLLGPSSFLEVAEESDLICEVDAWVLARACTDAATWAVPCGRPSLDLHVNLSARHLGRRRASRVVRAALGGSGLSPRRLVVELTETSLLTVNRGARADLDEIRDTGARLAADDFGTGYSTMTQLVALPLDQIKIDRYFVTGMVRDPRALAVVQALTGLARSLNQDVIAEGLETGEQAEALAELGITAVQGYLACPPLEHAELADLIRRGYRFLGRPQTGARPGAHAAPAEEDIRLPRDDGRVTVGGRS